MCNCRTPVLISRLTFKELNLSTRMPRYYEEDDPKQKKRACEGLRIDLRECLLESDCVRKDKRKPSECVKLMSDASVDRCRTLAHSFYECKRSLLDMRTRFRGPKGY